MFGWFEELGEARDALLDRRRLGRETVERIEVGRPGSTPQLLAQPGTRRGSPPTRRSWARCRSIRPPKSVPISWRDGDDPARTAHRRRGRGRGDPVADRDRAAPAGRHVAAGAGAARPVRGRAAHHAGGVADPRVRRAHQHRARHEGRSAGDRTGRRAARTAGRAAPPAAWHRRPRPDPGRGRHPTRGGRPGGPGPRRRRRRAPALRRPCGGRGGRRSPSTSPR